MLTDVELGRITIVLVRARNPQNIGAAARAMHDFGLSDLRIVNDYPLPLEGARSAVDASSVLLAATTHPTVGDAVADCTLVVGTTAIGERKLDQPVLTLSQAGAKLRAELLRTADGEAPARVIGETSARVALLFGSEKTGLSNEELSHCIWLLTIPMHQPSGGPETSRHLSMNLGQAVAVCLYELIREHSVEAPEASSAASSTAFSTSSTDHPATASERERLTGLLSEVLDASEYRRHHPANSDLADLRKLVLRMHLGHADTPVWLGMLRQILWKLRS